MTTKWNANLFNTDLHPTQKPNDKLKFEKSSWKNDQVSVGIEITTAEIEANEVQISVNTEKSDDLFSNEIIKTYWIKKVKAYTEISGYGSPTRPVPKGNRLEVPDVLIPYESKSIKANDQLLLWVVIPIAKDVSAGAYRLTLTISASNMESIEFSGTIEVLERTLPEMVEMSNFFDLELWQNPYAVAEYYNVVPFSEKHFEILKPHMLMYKERGGRTVTATVVEEAWAGQTYSKNEVKYPSMVQWTRTPEGTFIYDFQDFDRWINFNHQIGITDKIVAYGVVPWSERIDYYDKQTQQRQSIRMKYEENETQEIWMQFLRAFQGHLNEKGWLKKTFLGIDERGFHPEVFEIVNAVKDQNNEVFKTAGAMDGFVDKPEAALKVTDLSVGTMAIKAHPMEFSRLVQQRKEKGLKTSVYSCTGHAPGNFTLSAPVESYWTMIYALSVGGEGFLRWAYDSWVEEPLKDTTHNAFEAGDTFLIYPDEREAEHPISRSSIRLEKLVEGLRDVQKLMMLSREKPQEVERLLKLIKPSYSLNENGLYLSEEGKQILAEDMRLFREKLQELSK